VLSKLRALTEHRPYFVKPIGSCVRGQRARESTWSPRNPSCPCISHFRPLQCPFRIVTYWVSCQFGAVFEKD
jgi:hypothetical protein